jgi:hypothetical protein
MMTIRKRLRPKDRGKAYRGRQGSAMADALQLRGDSVNQARTRNAPERGEGIIVDLVDRAESSEASE